MSDRTFSRADGLRKELADLKNRHFSFDTSRGNPCPEQLQLATPLDRISERYSDGIDTWNYSQFEGIPAARKLMAEYLGATPESTWVLGNSSLTIFDDLISHAVRYGICGSKWEDPVLAVAEIAYDRHLEILNYYGVKAVPIKMFDHGPDVDTLKRLVSERNVVGMVLVPTYSNPTGASCTPAVMRSLFAMTATFPELRFFLDDAYREHHLTDSPAAPLDHFGLAAEYGASDRVILMGSTSKITLAGSGIAAVAMSNKNQEWFAKKFRTKMICPDKRNQLKHVQFLKNPAGIRAHMRLHQQILTPKFQAVDRGLSERLAGRNDVTWTKPKGGYFISVWLPLGTAARVVALLDYIGIKTTSASAGRVSGYDADNHLRLSPTALPVTINYEIAKAVALCIDLAIEELKK